MKSILANWKTTLTGVLLIISVSLKVLKIIDKDDLQIVAVALTAIGFGLSKDKNVTGGTKSQ